MSRIMFLYATAPDAATARKIGEALVEARLAACVNVLGTATSIYRWEGAVETAEETAFIVKTTQTAAGAARELILKLHPYETPAIAAINIDETGSNSGFLAWIRAESDAGSRESE
ncbi:MAG: divalent-cation tolerance protein CutA [Amphiplicatus sp.]